MDSYRVEKKAVQQIQLPDEDAEVEPVPTDGGGQKPEPEIAPLSTIIEEFNARFGNIDWKDKDKIDRVLTEELPAKVAADKAYQNAAASSRRAERPHRARQGPRTGRDRHARRPRRPLQALQRRPVVPQRTVRDDLRDDLRKAA